MAQRKKKKKLHIWGMELAILLGLTVAITFYITQKGDEPNQKSEQKQQETDRVLGDLSGCEAGDVLSKQQISTDKLSDYFTAEPISDEVFRRMEGNSYQENPDISIEDLRYLKVLHYNFDHEIQVGELVVNRAIARDCLSIFQELFYQQYEIASMYLVDRYYYDDEHKNTQNSEAADYNSVNNNNTSAFHYRVVSGTEVLSAHAYGLAIDINPLQNPSMALDEDGNLTNKYLDLQDYSDRTRAKEHMIAKGDVCYETFIRHGFIWGGEWDGPADYQHFEKIVTR
ncbi:MAG: M15 family metallopeptidase [Lachnospiraceae bacterium]|nr:M15 family metallopeptidase [Lachnospiraceae bacterium]